MEKYKPELNKDKLTDRILEEMSRPFDNGQESSRNTPRNHSRKFANIERNIEVVAAHADLGESAPSMSHHRPGMRLPARVAARMILYLAKFVLIPQKCINRAVMEIALGLTNHAKETSDRIDLLNRSVEEVGKISEAVETLQGSIHEIQTLPDRVQQLAEELEKIKSLLNQRINRPAVRTEERLIQGQRIWQESYASFEDQFRGTREDIKNRFRTYIPLVKDAVSGKPGMTVLDIGSGRGEWLELLRDAGIESSGLDQNPFFVNDCRRRGLSVVQAESIEYLSNLPAGSYYAVTAFHLIEHLDPKLLFLFGQLVFEALKPGGLLILETPNPENTEVARFKFHLDPTHYKPIPSDLLFFILDYCGFKALSVRGLHPVVTGECEKSPPMEPEQFSSFQDYAITAWKPE